MSVEYPASLGDILAANRDGKLAEAQRKRIRITLNSQVPLGLGVLLPAGLFFYAIYLGVNTPSSQVDLNAVVVLLVMASPFVLGAAWIELHAARLWADLRDGRVDQGSGELTWSRGAYRAGTPGRRLDLAGMQLAAGTYMFYYLPRSGRIVGAESLAQDTPGQARDLLLRALAESNRFKLACLDDYRAGRLGSSRAHLLRLIWAAPAWIILFAVLALAAFLVIVERDEASAALFPLCLGDLAAALVLLWSGVRALRPTFDVLAGRVAMVEGAVRKEEVITRSGRSSSVHFYYRLDKFRWSVSREAFDALLEGGRYRVYYLPRSRRLAAIEPLVEGA